MKPNALSPFRYHNLLFMSKTRSYAQILIGSRLFLTAMAIHLSLRVAPLDLQQSGNYRILYVHVPAARMSIIVYIATAINTFLFLLKKHPLSLRSSGTGTEMGCFFVNRELCGKCILPSPEDPEHQRKACSTNRYWWLLDKSHQSISKDGLIA